MPPVASTTAGAANRSSAAVCVAHDDPRRGAVVGAQHVERARAFDEHDRLGGAHGRGDRAHEFGARRVAARAQDAAARVRRFAAERVMRRVEAIEAHAERRDPLDRVRPVRRQARRDAPFHDARAGRHRIGRVQRGRIVVADGGRDAALRPRRRRPLAERTIRHERRAQGPQVRAPPSCRRDRRRRRSRRRLTTRRRPVARPSCAPRRGARARRAPDRPRRAAPSFRARAGSSAA